MQTHSRRWAEPLAGAVLRRWPAVGGALCPTLSPDPIPPAPPALAGLLASAPPAGPPRPVWSVAGASTPGVAPDGAASAPAAAALDLSSRADGAPPSLGAFLPPTGPLPKPPCVRPPKSQTPAPGLSAATAVLSPGPLPPACSLGFAGAPASTSLLGSAASPSSSPSSTAPPAGGACPIASVPGGLNASVVGSGPTAASHVFL